ncbi:MAG TPA: spermidine/putrescine ABC transporter permease, partial [Clostridiaceae bacterium]|nr:spermidine/putrescine ABC transporter permease [Clostridiaceae bacterium]
QDNFVVPKQSKNKKAAELFMNFILEPEISAKISMEFPYANPNKAAYPYIDDIRKDIAVYPPDEYVKSGEHLKDIGQSIGLFDSIWTEIKK